MGIDVFTLNKAKRYTNLVALGLASATVDDVNKSITFTLASDGSQHTIHFSQPSDGKDGISVTGVSDKGNGIFTLLFSDGSESDPIQTIKGQKGDKGDKLTFNDLTDEEKASLKGTDGFSPSAKIEKVGDTATITITDKDGTTTATIKDGQGGTGGSGEENKIDSISVNGVNVTIDENKNVDITVPSIDGLAKTEDIPTNVSELTNDSGYLTEHQDISGKVDKVDGKSLIADSEITRLASVDNYDDTAIKNSIKTVADGLMDSVGYSADYKTIDIIAKNGVKKSVNVAPIISHASITELSDVDTTNKATGKALVYNATTSKHEYADVSGTDEKVKMDASTDAKYLGELLDNVTIANENGELKVKKLDGQEVTITEINYLKGLTMNVMDLVNMFSNGGVKIINTPVATYAELLTIDKSAFIEGISYLVYVLADENHDNAKTTYLVDKDSETPTYFGFADSQRDFTTNPIDLATEITGKLGISNMDSDAIKALFTVDDTYKTETATNNAFSTHGAKALYDELLLAIGNKANSSDLTAHKDDADIHVSTEDRTKWDSAKTHADSAHAPSNAQANVIETVNVNGTALKVSNKAVNIDLSGYAGNEGRITKETDFNTLTENAIYAVTSSAYAINAPTPLSAGILYVINGGISSGRYIHQIYKTTTTDKIYSRISYNTGIDWREWKEITTTAEVDSIVDNKLNTLEYGDIAGGKNLVYKTIKNANIETNGTIITTTDATDIHVAKVKSGKTYTFTADSTVYAFYSVEPNFTIKSYDSSRVTSGSRTITIPSGVSYLAFRTLNTYTTPMVNEGSTSLPYEPYIPSVKMLADEISVQNSNLNDYEYTQVGAGSPGAANCNDFYEYGNYTTYRAYAPTNCPTGLAWGFFETIPFRDEGYAKQICKALATNRVYIRTLWDGTWGSWTEFATMDDTTSSTTSTYSSSKIDKKLNGTSITVPHNANGFLYYSIAYRDVYENSGNQGILIQHNRLNFASTTYLFTGTKFKSTESRCFITKISGNTYKADYSSYAISFYLDKEAGILYLKIPTYSMVSLTDLLVQSNEITATKVDAIPDTATKMTVIEYASTASLANYSIPLNLYMGSNHYLAIKVKVHDMNYYFNMSDRSGNIYEGTFFSYNGSFSVQITKINNSLTKIGYTLGFRQYKVSSTEFYLVAKVSDYTYINGVINTSSALKSNIEILVNDDSTLWDNGTDIVVKELATTDKLGGLTFSASGTTLSITDGTNTWTLEANS